MSSITRRRFLEMTGATVGVGATAGCAQRGGTNRAKKGIEDGLPTIRYAGIPKTQLNDLMLLFHQSDHLKEEVMPNVGETYEVELVTVQGTPLVVNTLGANEADAGILAYSSLANAIANGAISGGPRVVAPLTYDGPRYADKYCTAQGSDVTAVEDLAGRSFAVNAIGSAIDIAARVTLRQHGVDESRVNFRELSFGAIPATVDEGKVDVGTFIQPFYEQHRDSLEPVFDTTDAFGNFLKIFVTVRDDFLAENGEAVRHWLADFWEGVKWWRDDANAEKRLDIAEEVIGLPRGLLEQLVQSDRGYYHGEDGLAIDAKWLQKPVDGMREVGYLNRDLDVSEYVDGSYLPKEANTKPPLG